MTVTVENSNRKLNAIINGARAILGHDGFAVAARAIFDECRLLIGATSGYVALLSEDGRENEVLFLEDGGMACTVDPELPMPIRGLRAEAYRDNRVVFDNDFMNSPWAEMMPSGHMALRNVMFAPLVLDNATVGIMGMANKSADFTRDDADTAAVFGELAAIALRNARSLEQSRQACEQLGRSEVKYRTLLNNQHDAVFLCPLRIDSFAPFSEINEMAVKRYGYSREEFGALSLEDLTRPDEAQRYLSSVAHRAVLQQGQSVYEMTHCTRTGDCFPVEISASRITLDGHAYMLCTARDISRRKQAQDALKLSREQYRQVIENAPLGIVTVDSAGRILGANPFFRQMVGYSSEELQVMTVQQITFADDLPREQQMIREMIAERKPAIQLEKRYCCKDGRIVWAQLTTCAVRGSNGKVLFGLGLVEDITEKKAAAVERGELEKQLKQSRELVLHREKMASLGQLAAGIAHEINNPIGFIKSNLNTLSKHLGRISEFLEQQRRLVAEHPLGQELDQLQENCRLDYLLEDSLDIIRESQEGIGRAGSIITGLKSFARNDADTEQLEDLNECLEAAINLVWNEIKYKTRLEKELDENLPRTRCHQQKLEQVFINLLVNAAQAIDSDGTGRIRVRSWTASEQLYMAVEDNGCGIAQEHLSRIFEPFFTTKEVGQGTGLGMSISYEIVRSHGGEMTVDSRLGEGTTVTVALPIRIEG